MGNFYLWLRHFFEATGKCERPYCGRPARRYLRNRFGTLYRTCGHSECRVAGIESAIRKCSSD